MSFGMAWRRQEGRGGVGMKRPAVIHGSGAEKFSADRPLGAGLPKDAGLETVIPIVAMKTKLVGGDSDTLSQQSIRKVKGRTDGDGEAGQRFPGDYRGDRNVIEFGLKSGISEGRGVRPFHAQPEGSVDAQSEGER